LSPALSILANDLYTTRWIGCRQVTRQQMVMNGMTFSVGR
jgi:hypothetical protein